MLKYMRKRHVGDVTSQPVEPAPPQVQPEEMGDGSSSSNRLSVCDTMKYENDIPSSSPLWRVSDGKHSISATAQQKALPSTPPLSPSSSVISDELNRSSSSSFTDSASPPHANMVTTVSIKSTMPFAPGDINFVAGPPIIPRSRTPPPPPQQQQQQQQKQQSSLSEESSRHHPMYLKSIFDDDDDDGNDGKEVTDVDFEFFFNEFSRRPLESKRNSNKRKSVKVRRMSKFNLAAFANHLYQNRMSVMQLRESRILLTGEDELELMRLLEQRKSTTPGSTFPPPPVQPPPLPPMSDFREGGKQETINGEIIAPPSPPSVDVVSVQDKIDQMELTPIRTLSKKTSRRRQAVRKSMSMDEIRRMAVGEEKTLVSDMEPIQEDPTGGGQHKEEEEEQPQQMPLSPGPSSSTSYLKSKFEMGNDKRSKAIGLFGSLRHATNRSTSFKGLVRNLSSASLSARYLQGSKAAVQQKGKEQKKVQDQDQLEDRHRQHLFLHKKKSRGVLEETNNTMSPAARVVMQLDKKESKSSMTDAAEAAEAVEEVTEPEVEGAPHPTHLKNSLLAHLLTKACKARRTKTVNMASTSSKRKGKTKSRVIRRTIIYVPPDSLNFLINLENKDTGVSKPPCLGDSKIIDGNVPPPFPTDTTDKLKLHRMGTGEEEVDGMQGNYYDDESLYDYYNNRESIMTTTTVAAPPQLEGLELRELEDGTVEWGIVKKQGSRKSFYSHGQQNATEEENDEDKVEEQVLKTMGLPVPSALLLSSSPPPPLPRRSPRRRLDSEHGRAAEHISTTHASDALTIDVYYAPQQTLPSLLQMIVDQAKEEEDDEQAYLEGRRKKQASVEDQLDDMMRSFQRVDYK